jgi:hypothetical protein
MVDSFVQPYRKILLFLEVKFNSFRALSEDGQTYPNYKELEAWRLEKFRT